MGEEISNLMKSFEKQPNRDMGLDILRVLGLSLIILAHSGPPDLIFQLRNFDVPLMLIVSGASFNLVCEYQKVRYFQFIGIRLARLVAPAWVFLVVFFPAAFIIVSITGTEFPFTMEKVISSFILFSGIPYIWVVRVFILVAIVAPIARKLNSGLPNQLMFFLVILCIYGTYEVTCQFYYRSGAYGSFFVEEIMFYMIPYSCVFTLGLRLSSLTIRTILLISIVLLGIFCLLAVSNYHFGLPMQTQKAKYPPRLYYLSYSISVSLLAYSIVFKKQIRNVVIRKMLIFISSSSIWIYLWHILFLYVYMWFPPPKTSWADNFLAIFSCVFFSSVILTYIQKQAVERLLCKHTLPPKVERLISLALLK
jgi:hypothetical protein